MAPEEERELTDKEKVTKARGQTNASQKRLKEAVDESVRLSKAAGEREDTRRDLRQADDDQRRQDDDVRREDDALRREDDAIRRVDDATRREADERRENGSNGGGSK